ncbi:MAG: sulfotransferase [Bacteroidales bacterium]
MMKSLYILFFNYFGEKIEKRQFTETPVYIGGCGRSGTTLLLSILSAHNNIFGCPTELNLFDGAEETGSGIKNPKFYRLYRTFIVSKIKASAKRYCEKSPSNIHYIELIDKLHNGNFKFIHIVRDGRDVILSRHPKGKGKYWVDPERWIADVSNGLKYMEHPSVYTIRYEDLVGQYRETIESVCHFLEIPVSKEILNWHQFATVRQNNALYSKITEISTSPIGKWEQPENGERVRLLTENPEAVALLKKFRYLS